MAGCCVLRHRGMTTATCTRLDIREILSGAVCVSHRLPQPSTEQRNSKFQFETSRISILAALASAGVLVTFGGHFATLARTEVHASDTSEDDEKQAVRLAIEHGTWEPVEKWIKRNGIEAHLTLSKQTALAFAAEYGSIYVVRSLLGAGADATCCDNQGFSVLNLASRRGHSLVVRALLDSRAKPDFPLDIFGNGPIHGAVGFGHLSVVKELLQAQCNPDQRQGDIHAPESYGAKTLHEAPLHLACRAKPPHLEAQSQALVGLLLRHGANPCLQDDRGDTPAHHLARKGDAGTLWILVSRAQPELADFCLHGLRNANNRTAADEITSDSAQGENSLVLRTTLLLGPRAAWLRQRVPAYFIKEDENETSSSGDDEEHWQIYRERLDNASALMSFEDGGDGVRRRTEH